MALPPLASVEQLADWLGEPISDAPDISRAGGALRTASALVRRETGRTWVDPDNPKVLNGQVPEEAEIVTLQAAARGYTNPDALTSERIDDAQVARKVEEAGVYLTASERDLLAPLAGRAHQGLGTVSTFRGDTPPVWDSWWWINGPTPAPDEVY